MPEKQRRSIFDAMSEYMEEFENLADEIMESAFPEGPSWNCDACCLHALCNVFITAREIIITADLPNTEPETVKVEVLDENLVGITAEMREKVRFSDLGIYHRHGEFSSLRCQVRIPITFDTTQMELSFQGGILEARFPRKKIDK